MLTESLSGRIVLTWTPIVLLIALAVKLVQLWRRHAQFAQVVNRVPGPPTKPLFGNAWDLWVPRDDIVNALLSLMKRRDPVFRIWIGFEARFVVQQAKAAEIILKSPECVSKSDEYHVSHYWIGFGLLTSPKEKWEKRRRLLNHSFHTQILDGYLPIFNEQSVILVKCLKSMLNKGPFEVGSFTSHFSLDVVCETTMGVKMRTQENFNCEYVKCVHGMVTIYMLRSTLPWMNNQFLFNLTKYRKQEIENVKLLQGFTRDVIQKRRELRDKELLEDQTKKAEDIMGRKRRLATLDLLLESTIDGQPLTDSDILEEVQIMCVAGHDTTASCLAWTLSHLGHTPEVQKKAQDEIYSIFGDSEEHIDVLDIPKLKYLEAVIKESLRLQPPIPFFGRKLDTDIAINGYTLPANTSILFSPYLTHRDPDVFPDPEIFDPERFLTSRIYTPYEYLPFSAGPRNCIGHRFAMAELKVALVHILRNFNIVSHTDHSKIKYIFGPVLLSHNGLHISLSSRKTNRR